MSVCARCKRPVNEHPNGDCPDGGGSFTWAMNPDLIEFFKECERDNVPESEQTMLWLKRVLAKEEKERKGSV